MQNREVILVSTPLSPGCVSHAAVEIFTVKKSLAFRLCYIFDFVELIFMIIEMIVLTLTVVSGTKSAQINTADH